MPLHFHNAEVGEKMSESVHKVDFAVRAAECWGGSTTFTSALLSPSQAYP